MIKKDDQVQVIAGKDKGKVGKVLLVLSKTNRVLVEKVNLLKKHVKPSQANPQGGILEKEVAIHYSNVLMMCPKCNRGVRTKVKAVEAATKGKKAAAAKAGSKKIRHCKKCDHAFTAA